MPILEQFSSDVISGCKEADKQQGKDLEDTLSLAPTCLWQDGLCASFFRSVSFMFASSTPLEGSEGPTC